MHTCTILIVFKEQMFFRTVYSYSTMLKAITSQLGLTITKYYISTIRNYVCVYS